MKLSEILESRQLELNGLITKGLQLFTQNAKNIIPLYLILFLPYYSVYFIAHSFLKTDPTPIYFLIEMIFSLVSAMIIVLSAGSMSVLIENAVNDNQITWNAALNYTADRFLSIFWTFLVSTVLLLICAIPLFIPLVIFGIYWFFAPQISTVRNISGTDALRYSKKLIEGYWWQTLGYLIIAAFCAVVPLFFIILISSLVFSQTQASAIFGLAYQLISMPITTIVILYFLNLDYSKNGIPGKYKYQDILNKD